jgi:hypothetical protein
MKDEFGSMKLDRVTITGADDDVRIEDLDALSQAYPFVEWGVLFSGSKLGVPRYPTRPWVERLAAASSGGRMRLSAHLCGAWVRELLVKGEFGWSVAHRPLLPAFGRVQLNAHGKYREAGTMFCGQLSVWSRRFAPENTPGMSFILQCAGRPDYDVAEELAPWCRLSVLFDRSGGLGVVPGEWPRALAGIYCGYAGGLGPHNLHSQLQLIERAAGPARVWVDMESGVRDDKDAFDIGKARRALEQAAPWIKAAMATHESNER